LSRGVNRGQQTPATELCLARTWIDLNLAKPRKLDHQTVVASAEAGQAMTTTANSGHEARSSHSLQAGLNVPDVLAASKHGGPAIEHSIPHGRNFAVLDIVAPQECSFKTSANRLVNVFYIVVHRYSCGYANGRRSTTIPR
jgi:hypothetical protein